MDHSEDTARPPAGPADMPFWLSAYSYWQPAHLPQSAWITHAPFAFWLMEVLRPRAVVELGTHYGLSCFVFAEAARRLRLGTTVDALDTWEGDDQASRYGEEVYEYVRDVAQRDYPEAVRLRRGYFADSRMLIEDASVDLLHIDGRHGYHDVLEDYTSWRTSVREGGIVLFHDIAERQPGFGVWRLWEELSAQHPSFAFAHGSGLGVLAIGPVTHPALAALFAADPATAAQVRSDYEALGAQVVRARSMQERSAILEEIVSSHGWKITAPVRFVARLPRRVARRLRSRRR